MAAEQATENKNPFAAFKGLGKAIADVTGFKLHDQAAMNCGAKASKGQEMDPRMAALAQKGM